MTTFLYAAALFVWLMSIVVAQSKSWAALDVSKGKILARVIFYMVVVTIGAFVVSPSGPLHFDLAWFIPLVMPIYYIVYVIVSRKHRENVSDFFKADRWNGLVLLSSTFTATVCMIV
jgi:hypothetical protein